MRRKKMIDIARLLSGEIEVDLTKMNAAQLEALDAALIDALGVIHIAMANVERQGAVIH